MYKTLGFPVELIHMYYHPLLIFTRPRVSNIRIDESTGPHGYCVCGEGYASEVAGESNLGLSMFNRSTWGGT